MTRINSTVLPRIASLRAAGHRPLQCIASYYRSEDQARSALSHLRAANGLAQMQSTFWRPADAGSLKLRWQSRRWLGRWPFDAGSTAVTLGLTACFAGLFGLVLWAFWWTLGHLLAEPIPGAGSLSWWVLAALFGAGVCVALAVAGSGRMLPSNHFDRHVRRQLASGNWAIVAHDIPAHRQAAVLALMQHGCADWSAAAQAARRL